MDPNMHHFEFFPPVTTTDSDSLNVDEYSPLDFEELELIWRGEIDQNEVLLKCPADKCSLSSSTIASSVDASSTTTTIDAGLVFQHHQPLILPTENMKVGNQLIVHHLAKAYKEAMENKEAELAEVIARRISEKVSPVGGQINERLLYYLFQSFDKESEYLKQESGKNYDRALEAFYKIFPYGLIPHFAANSAILEAMPRDALVLHIVDFDMGEGVQWSSMIMALGQQQKELHAQQYYGLTPLFITLKLTAIKWKEEDNSSNVPPWRRYEETKERLHDCANIFGLMLEVREVELQDLVDEIKGMRRGGRREWLAFNCMWALPHMGRKRSRRHVLDFVRTAKDSLANSSCSYASDHHNGILTFGDGGGWELFKGCPNFGASFDRYMEHYQALLESIEWNFPICFEQARISMECLFVAPYVFSSAWAQNWKEIEEVCDFRTSFGLEGLRVSNGSLMEAKDLVREGETLYGVKIGENYNEISLEWRGSPLVRFSVWR